MTRFLEARIVRDEHRPALFYVELEHPILGQESQWDRVGPMSLDEAIERQKEHASTPNFGAQMEQTPTYQKLAKTIRKTRTPAYRAALKKQTEALADFVPTPFPEVRYEMSDPADPWTYRHTLTPAMIEDYQRRDRERKLRHMKAGRNRGCQPSASRAAATIKRKKAAANGERARAMRADGETNKTIAQHLGLSVRQVQRLLKK